MQDSVPARRRRLVQLVGSDYTACPFKTSTSAGGESGVDEVARAAIEAHAGNADIHVTATEKAAWNAVNYSNPNLLINPDFRINQRGQAEYTSGYTVDRWYSPGKCERSADFRRCKAHLYGNSVVNNPRFLAGF